MNTILSQINTNETIITINSEALLSGHIALTVAFIALAIFTAIICYQYKNAKKALVELNNKKIENQFISTVSKEERKIINMYNKLNDSDKESIVEMLKSLNSKE